MATLLIRQKKSKLMPNLPHKLFINGQFVGMITTPQVKINLPAGMYQIKIGSVIKYFSSTKMVEVVEEFPRSLTFTDREKIWDALFIVDIICWFADFFFTLPAPYDLIYQIFTNGYLVLWLVYELLIRNKYFKMEVS